MTTALEQLKDLGVPRCVAANAVGILHWLAEWNEENTDPVIHGNCILIDVLEERDFSYTSDESIAALEDTTLRAVPEKPGRAILTFRGIEIVIDTFTPEMYSPKNGWSHFYVRPKTTVKVEIRIPQGMSQANFEAECRRYLAAMATIRDDTDDHTAIPCIS